MILDQTTAYILNSLHADRAYIEEYIASDDQAEKYFSRWKIPKKDKSFRTVYRTKAEKLRNIYKPLYEELATYRPALHDAAHGFRKGRSTKSNATIHLGQNYLLNLDISDFFGTVSMELIKETFARLGANQETAALLTSLCTIQGVLPQGLQTSPDIANHCFYDIDVKLASYAESNDLKYSRYADDITFSGQSTIDEAPIVEIIEAKGFFISPQKTKLQKRGSNQYVTGLTIFDDQSPRISKRYKKNLRLELHLISTIGLKDYATKRHNYPSAPHPHDDYYPLWVDGLKSICGTEFERIKGKVSYINAIEPDQAQKMWEVLNQVDRSVFDIEY